MGEEERVPLPDEGGDRKIMTVAIYYPPIIPTIPSDDYVGSRIQDDEVSSTIEPPGEDDTAADKLEEEDPLKQVLQFDVKSEPKSGFSVTTGNDNVLKDVNVKANQVSIINNDTSHICHSQPPEEYPETQSPSTSQPSPSEFPKLDSEEILILTCATQPGIGDSETDRKQSLDERVECLPNLFLDEDDCDDEQDQCERKVKPEKKEEIITIATSPVSPSSEVDLAEKKADHVPDLRATLPLKHCRLVLTRCDEETKDSKGSLRTEKDFAFYDDQLLNNDIEKAKKRRDRAAKRKQETQPPPSKNSPKIERRGRPRKHLGEQSPGNTGNIGHRRRKRRGMAGTVRYSRYNKRLQKLKTTKLSSNGLLFNGSKGRGTKTDHEINLKTEATTSQEEIVLMEEEISMMDSCPSPNISDSESCVEDQPSLNIITAEDARKFVTAWVNTGEDEPSKEFENSPSKSQPTSSEPEWSPVPSTPEEYADGEDEEVLDEVEMKPLLKCSTCLKTFNNPMTLQVHMRLHTGERPYKCKCCGEAFIHYTYLNYHYKNTHGQSKSSSKAEPMPKGKGKTDNKISPPTSKRNLPASSSQKSKMKNHGQSSSVDQAESYICPYCKIRFQHASLLIIHLKRHSGDNPFQCSQCGQGFKYSRNLKRHIRQTHSTSKSPVSTMSKYLEEIPEADPDDILDPLSPNDASSVSNLTMRRLQLKKAGSKKKRSGTTGGKAGKNRKTFNPDSDDSYVQIRRYRCSYCGKKFLSPDGLKTHVRTHTKERPFQCTHCPTRFTQKIHMTKHIRLIHAENRQYNFKCTECQGGFQLKGNLERHTRDAHGNRVITESVAQTQSVTPTPRSPPLVGVGPHTVVTKTLKRRKKRKKLYFSNRHAYSFKGATNTPSKIKTTIIKEGRPKRDMLRSYVSLTRCDELVARLMEAKRESVNLQKKEFQGPSSEHSLYAKKSIPNQSNLRSNVMWNRINIQRPCKSSSSQLKPAGSHHDASPPGEKSYPCQFCGKRFSRWNNRYIHLRIHTGVKPYKCAICSKAFTQKQSLNAHIRAHAKRNEFPKDTSQM